MPKLLTRRNLEIAILYIRAYGIRKFMRKIWRKIKDINDSKQELSIAGEIPTERHKDSKKTKSIWDDSVNQYRQQGFKLYWELLPEINKYQFKCMTGDENVSFFNYTLDYVRKNIGSSNLRALSIGCTEGNPGPEITAFKTGIFEKIDVMDIAEGLLAKQSRIASNMGLTDIRFMQRDLNSAFLEKDTYDLIWAIGTIHHIENLEFFFDQVHAAMKDHGLFMMREYIGPNRMQFTEEQILMINEILSILPDKYKKMVDGLIKEKVERPDIDLLLKIDASESCRSQDIMAVMGRKLKTIKISKTGGTILHPLLNSIASNFEHANDEDTETILKLLILFEKTLIEKEILPSDYVFCLANKIMV